MPTILVVALGASYTPRQRRASRGGHDFYTRQAAFALRDVLANFDGGRVIVAVTSTPFKCPPAPSETALLMHDFLTDRGVRDRSQISLVMPLPVPIPPSPDASKALLIAFEERGIDWHPGTLVRGLDPARHVAMLSDNAEMPYDLFLGVPAHRVPEVVALSGMTVDGWIPVNPMTLETQFPGVYAVGGSTVSGRRRRGFAEARRQSPPGTASSFALRESAITTDANMLSGFGTTRWRKSTSGRARTGAARRSEGLAELGATSRVRSHA